ncbi:hypothetical protein D3C86_1693520 [compost metagenome]
MQLQRIVTIDLGQLDAYTILARLGEHVRVGQRLLGQHRRRHGACGHPGRRHRLDQQIFPGEVIVELNLASIRQGDLAEGGGLGQQGRETEGDQQSGQGLHRLVTR